ncbi:prephenate dehydratase [Motilimonas pumila]|uniref:prephenate dehydratase n=1 Tax=Motilimonas pumila TaxID=2303987 RepID=A0A418Y9J0_9GAMM|nr:prephenate dehydratase domain-containing protein [Motilimonas pumila]RJG37547.1 ACT domain-containing protein [Motilimonas pumila]
MSVIATLGPKDTFSDMATRKYMDARSMSAELVYFPTLKTTFNAIGNTADFGVLPIENLSEGYVQVVLDALMSTELAILDEVLLPIKFAFVSSCQDLSELEHLYVQFVAHGQCSEFIEGLPDVTVHNTQSNMESLAQLQGRKNVGAVIPHHALSHWQEQGLVIDNVTDYAHNQTRFLVLGRAPKPYDENVPYKTTLVVRDDHDKPGVLGSIITAFSNRKINMTSIMSRPTKSQLGKYHFFIDIEGHCTHPDIAQAIAQINAAYRVKVLGSYPIQNANLY